MFLLWFFIFFHFSTCFSTCFPQTWRFFPTVSEVFSPTNHGKTPTKPPGSGGGLHGLGPVAARVALAPPRGAEHPPGAGPAGHPRDAAAEVRGLGQIQGFLKVMKDVFSVYLIWYWWRFDLFGRFFFWTFDLEILGVKILFFLTFRWGRFLSDWWLHMIFWWSWDVRHHLFFSSFQMSEDHGVTENFGWQTSESSKLCHQKNSTFRSTCWPWNVKTCSLLQSRKAILCAFILQNWETHVIVNGDSN